MIDTDDADELWLFTSYSDESDVQAVSKVIKRDTWWAKGPEVETFEETIAERAGCKHGIAFNSGTSALFACLQAADVAGGEVIVPSFTYPATANAAVLAGAKPIFADIETDSLALDPEDVEDKITDETEAVVPIHFAGDVCAGIHDLRKLAAEHDIRLIEDAAHSLGATLDGQPVGSFGDAAMFSFCFNKVLTTGEGGMIVTDDDELANQIRLIRSHGQDEDGVYRTTGHNLRLSSMSAALGVSQAEKLDWMIKKRREYATHLNERLSACSQLRRPIFPDRRDSVYQLYNVLFEDESVQQPLQEHLEEQEIPTRVTYSPVHLTAYYRKQWGYGKGDLPVTESVSNRILTLPFHLNLDVTDLDRIADGVIEFFD